jgi:proteic killer suppression protein
LRFRFEDRKLRRLYEQSSGREKLPEGVATAFDEVVSMIESAADERDLYALKSLRYEKLSGPRRGQRSLRLNDQWRMIITVTTEPDGPLVRILEVADYH